MCKLLYFNNELLLFLLIKDYSTKIIEFPHNTIYFEMIIDKETPLIAIY